MKNRDELDYTMRDLRAGIRAQRRVKRWKKRKGMKFLTARFKFWGKLKKAGFVITGQSKFIEAAKKRRERI